MSEPLLELRDAAVHYGGVRALDDVSLKIKDGELVALMGPNGAGKSTVLKALVGLVPLSHGTVHWEGKRVAPVAYEMAQRGIAYVPQGRQVFKNLSVEENLVLGGYCLPRKRVADNIAEVYKMFPILKEKRRARAGLLSGGQQQMLTIARGLVSDPKVMLLDEPSLGLAPKVVKEVFSFIEEINRVRRLAIIIVEHSIESVLKIAHRAYVLSHGKVVISRNAKEVHEADLQKVFLQ